MGFVFFNRWDYLDVERLVTCTENFIPGEELLYPLEDELQNQYWHTSKEKTVGFHAGNRTPIFRSSSLWPLYCTIVAAQLMVLHRISHHYCMHC